MLHLASSRSTRESEARLDEPEDEKERGDPGSLKGQCEKTEESGVEEFGVEGLGGDSWPFEDLLGDGNDDHAGERGWSVLHDDCARWCDGLPSSESVSGGATTVVDDDTDRLIQWSPPSR